VVGRKKEWERKQYYLWSSSSAHRSHGIDKPIVEH
jgi:hypothetical protein